jgi:hypothetical protein
LFLRNTEVDQFCTSIRSGQMVKPLRTGWITPGDISISNLCQEDECKTPLEAYVKCEWAGDSRCVWAGDSRGVWAGDSRGVWAGSHSKCCAELKVPADCRKTKPHSSVVLAVAKLLYQLSYCGSSFSCL